MRLPPSWVFGVCFSFSLLGVVPASAQKPEIKELARLKTEVNRLRQELEERERQVKQSQQEAARLRQELNECQQLVARLRQQLTAEQRDDKRWQAEVKELREILQARYVHVVLFYLKSDASPKQAEVLMQDCQKMLGKIPNVRYVWVGPPAKQATPDVAQQDFHVGLVVLFDDYAGLKKYLDHPLHKQFVEKHNRYIERVVVHDFLGK